MNITAKTKICMIIGDPVEHSLSPQMHNAAYEAVGIDDQFVTIAAHVPVKDIAKVIDSVKLLGIRGLICTVPHKVAVIPYLDKIDPIAKKIGAVNSVVNNNGVVTGYNTDWLGVSIPLEKVTSLENKTIAILGAGGAARAAIYAVSSKGAKVMIYNRTLPHAEELAKEFKGKAFPLTEIEKINDADIIINTTSVGLHPHEKETPLDKKYLTKKHIVFDIVYTSRGTTRLLDEAKKQGATVISGMEMLLYQGLEQFKLFTGHKAPEEVMRKVILNNIK
jgi:shikimate dehydrogenase